MSQYIPAPASLKEPNYSQWVLVKNLSSGVNVSTVPIGIVIDEINNIVLFFNQGDGNIYSYNLKGDTLIPPLNPIYGTGDYVLNTFTSNSKSLGFNAMNRRATIRGRYKLLQASDVAGNALDVYYVYDGDKLLQTIDYSSLFNGPNRSDAAISLFGTYIVIVGEDNNFNQYVFLYQGQP
jgi:hypothetical protein